MRKQLTGYLAVVLISLSAALGTGCDGDDIDSDEEARRAYLGLDFSIEKALNLGMKGYGEASSANIPPQSGVGDDTGTIDVTGQVDQGASSNKEMRLYVALDEYSDGPFYLDEDMDEELEITYFTDPEDLPYLQLSLRNIPDGTFTGTLTGTYEMTGGLEGVAELELTMSGEIESDGADGIQRVIGTTEVTGVARSGDGTYEVNVLL